MPQSFEAFLREKYKGCYTISMVVLRGIDYVNAATEWHSQEMAKAVPSREEIKRILFQLYPMSYGDDGECQLKSADLFIDGNKIATAIRALCEGKKKI
jgi:hypothetical protein